MQFIAGILVYLVLSVCGLRPFNFFVSTHRKFSNLFACAEKMASFDLQKTLQSALGYHKSGNFVEALKGYEIVLSNLPTNDKTLQTKLSLYGNADAICLQEGDYDSALRHFEGAVAIAPQHAPSQYNLAVLLDSKLNQHAKALKHCALAIKYDPNNHKSYHLMGNIMQSLGKEKEAEKYYQLAQSLAGDDESTTTATKNDISSPSKFESWLNLHKAKPLNTITEHVIDGRVVKVSYLSHRPLLISIDDFLTLEECQAVQTKASNLLQKSYIMGNAVTEEGELKDSDPYRSSFSAFLPRDGLLSSLQNRLSQLIALPLPYIAQKSEDLQVVRYDIGGQFKLHQDSSQYHKRMLTALVYLNDISVMGGETWFPFTQHNTDTNTSSTLPNSVEQAVLQGLESYDRDNLSGTAVKPQLGKAIVFVNYNSDGSLDPLAVHAGLPTYHSEDNVVEGGEKSDKSGEKWIANYRKNHSETDQLVYIEDDMI